MNWNDQQQDPLDELLSAARWPAPQTQQLERLEQQWSRIVRRRKRRLLAASLMAAMLLPMGLLIGSISILPDRSLQREAANQQTAKQATINQETQVVKPPESVAMPKIPKATDQPQPQRTYVRDPNMLEQTLAMVHRRRAKTSRPTLKPPTVAAKTVDPAVERLFAAMYSSRIDTRLAAASQLGEMNNPHVSKRLAEMALEGSVRREALIALLQSSDKVANQFLAYAQRDALLAPSLRALTANRGRSNQIH
jgi:hypothetical protein